MPSPFSVVVTVGSPARPGGSGGGGFSFKATEFTCTWTWGLQPGTALIDWASVSGLETDIPPFAQMQIDVGGHTFYGICKSVVPVKSTQGITIAQEFVDTREFLMWDAVFGAFNMRESKIVDGVWVRRYWHILPANFPSHTKTYTNTPYSAVQILNFLFGAPTVQSPWTRFYHSALNEPIYQLDCMGGPMLGTVVAEISERLGTVFTLAGGQYTLQWIVKGLGEPPQFPANSDNRRRGFTLSGHPSRLTAVGGRSLYQVLNCELEADWRLAWQNFYDLDIFADDIFQYEALEANFGGIGKGTPYNSIPGDTRQLVGRQLAAARARTITVGQYADLRDARSGNGEQFRDYRKFNNRSRMGMPVALYLRTIVFRAFRLPGNFYLRNANGANVYLKSMELVDRALVETSHNAVTGEIYVAGLDVVTAGNGYLIAQGYQIGSGGFKTLRPETFDLNQWRNLQEVWQHVPFQIDNSGEGDYFVIADTPIFKSGDLLNEINISGESGNVQQDYPALKANATLTIPRVKGALVLAAEPFTYLLGDGSRDGVERLESVNGEYIAYASHAAPYELAYADGQTASQKAYDILSSLLNRQFIYELGGYTVQGSNATQLSSMIDRVTVRYSAGGLTEEVDFTAERPPGTMVGVRPDGKPVVGYRREPERDFDRRAQLVPLLPGQRELKEAANEFRLFAAGLRQNPQFAKTLLEAFYDELGLDNAPTSVFIPTGTGTIPVGTPIFHSADKTGALPPSPVMPGMTLDTPLQNPVFMGVTIFDGERANGPVRITSSGNGGVVYCRVKGPVQPGDVLKYSDDNKNYLVKA